MTPAPIGQLLDWRLRRWRGIAQGAPARRFDAAASPRQRALALLWRFLSGAQREDLWRRHYFDVIGSDGRRYRLNAATRVYNIHDVAGGMRYCAGPAGVPMGDLLLGQKLWLEGEAPGLLFVPALGVAAEGAARPPLQPDDEGIVVVVRDRRPRPAGQIGLPQPGGAGVARGALLPALQPRHGCEANQRRLPQERPAPEGRHASTASPASDAR